MIQIIKTNKTLINKKTPKKNLKLCAKIKLTPQSSNLKLKVPKLWENAQIMLGKKA